MAKNIVNKKTTKEKSDVEEPVVEEVTTEAVAATDEPVDEWATSNKASASHEIEFVVHSGKFNEARSKMLIYAESGTGKTRFAATYPGVVFLDADHGLSSVDWEVAQATITNFHQAETFVDILESGEHDYETVVVDTLNALQVDAGRPRSSSHQVGTGSGLARVSRCRRFSSRTTLQAMSPDWGMLSPSSTPSHWRSSFSVLSIEVWAANRHGVL